MRDRSVYRITRKNGAAVYYLADDRVGGILINSPPFSEGLAGQLAALAPIRYVFYPSRFGAVNVDRWRAHTGAQSLAFYDEVAAIEGSIDIVLNGASKLSRTIDILPMSGRTSGCGILCARNLPGALFLGPALSPGESGWPALAPESDDYSYENRLFGCLGLQDLRYEYVFTDVFVPGETHYGPGAARAVCQELERVLY